VTDKITFDEFGDPTKGAAVVRIEGGQTSLFKWVAPVSQLRAVNDGPTDWPHTTTLTATVATGSDVAYTWALGDGSAGSGQAVTHFYPMPGEYAAVVTASNWFNSITATTTVEVIGYRVLLPVLLR
jgi:PKD repeat protein